MKLAYKNLVAYILLGLMSFLSCFLLLPTPSYFGDGRGEYGASMCQTSLFVSHLTKQLITLILTFVGSSQNQTVTPVATREEVVSPCCCCLLLLWRWRCARCTNACSPLEALQFWACSYSYPQPVSKDGWVKQHAGRLVALLIFLNSVHLGTFPILVKLMNLIHV